MSKELTFVFGRNDTNFYPQHQPSNVLVSGKPGSGMLVMLHNIIDTLILRYDLSEVHVLAYDGSAEHLVPTESGAGLASVPQCFYVNNSDVVNFATAIRHMYERLHIRMTAQPVFKDVVFLDHTESLYEDLPDKAKQQFRELLDIGPDYGMYFVVSEHDNTYFDKFMRYFPYHVVTESPTKEISKYLFEEGIVSESIADRNQIAVVHSDAEAVVLTVPFYTRERKVEITNEIILPHGHSFSYEARASYALFHQLPLPRQ